MDYNYERFDLYVESGEEAKEFGAFPNHLHVGAQAPDFEAVVLDDESTVRLSSLWKSKPLVVEFGSFT